MKLWAAVAGALIGWSTSYYGVFGLVAGGILGALMGAWLQAVLRTEIARELSLRGEWFPLPAERQTEEIQGEPAAAEPPPPLAAPEPAPPRRPEVEPERVSAPEPAMASQAPAGPSTSQVSQEPSAIDLLFTHARDWLLGGNTIVRVGLVVLFIGLMFLARLVVNAGLFPIEARLATVGASGAALLGVGYWKRIERPDFGLHLQGAGVAVMYLTVFAAARIYEVMPPGVAFGFMIVFAALGAILAVLQNSLTMAMASFLGGFAVPFLLGGDAETPTALFTYFAVLNLAVMGIAWKKSWRPLNLLGFFATFLMAGVWGFGAYETRHFWICEAFLAISITIYLATALLYAHNTPGKLGNFADSTLLFGTAIAGFGLQAGLVHDKPYWAAWSAVVFGAVYLAVATWAFKRRDKGMGLLSECLLAIGVGFVTMAIPLALDVEWVGVAWLLEGAAALWVGARQQRWMPRAFGLLLQAAGAVMVFGDPASHVSALPLAHAGFLQPFLGSIALLFSAWVLRNQLSHSGSSLAKIWEPIERGVAAPWFLGAFAMAAVAIMGELLRLIPTANPELWGDSAYTEQATLFGFLIAVLGLMALADWFGRKVQWKVASWPARISLLLIGFCFLQSVVLGRYVVQLPDLPVWIAAFALHFWMLRRADKDPASAAPRWNGFIHACGVLGLTVMLANALFYGVDQADLWVSSWAGVVFLVAGVAILMGITRWAGPASVGTAGLAMGWPHNVHSRAYWWRAAAPLAVVLYFGALIGTVLARGITDPLPYIPLLNPVDLSIALVLAALALWRQMLQGAEPAPRGSGPFTGSFGLGAGAVLAFVWINTIWTRTADHYLGATWYPASNANSQVVLTGFSILWTLMAMGLMLLGQRKVQRLPWLTGAALLAVVVAKLIFVDMSAVEGFARIASFIGVGVLMLLIGYFVPLPPRKGEEEGKP